MLPARGKAPLLDGGLPVKVDTLTNTVTSTYGITGNQSAKVSAGLKYETLTYPNPDIPNRGEIEFCQPINDRRVEFLKSIKKGSVSATRFVQSSDCLVLRCLRLISAFAAVTKKPAVLSPSLLSCSIRSKSSRGSLTETCNDLLFFLPVAIPRTPSNRWCSVCTRKLNFQMLTWCSPLTILVVFTFIYLGGRNSETPQWWNTNGASNYSDNVSIEAAMENYITPLTGRNSLTPNQSFRWLFLALERGNPTAKPHRIEATAPNEHSARLLLVRDYILAFAGRVPVREVTV